MNKIIVAFCLMILGVYPCSADVYNSLAKKISKAAEHLANKKIAVLPFQYFDGRQSPGCSIVSEQLTTSIVQEGKLQVIERTLLDRVLNEMKLEKSGVIDQDTTKGLGKILGVEAIVSGTLIEEIGSKEVKINARLIKVETGNILVAASKKIDKTWQDVPMAALQAANEPFVSVKSNAQQSKNVQETSKPSISGPSIAVEDEIWVADIQNDTVSRLNKDGALISVISQEAGKFSNPWALIAVGDGVWVVNGRNSTISRLNKDGTLKGIISRETGKFSSPWSPAVLGDEVWVVNERNNNISRLNKDGTLKGIISQEAGKLSVFWRLTVVGDEIWVENNKINIFTRFSKDGVLKGTFSREAGKYMTRWLPIVAGDEVWVADEENNTVTRLNKDGTLKGIISQETGKFFYLTAFMVVGDEVWWFNENNTISRLKKDGTLKGVISQEAGKDIINKLQGEANAHAEHDAGAK